MFDHDDSEFDIQKTILKKKEHKNGKFYVEYDKLTNRVFSVTPTHTQITEFRRGQLEVDENTLIRDIFNNKIPLHTLRVKYDIESNTRILYRQTHYRKSEFDYVTVDKNKKHFINLQCDPVAKRIVIAFDDIYFKNQLATERVNETLLKELPEHISLYCIDKHEPSRLYDTLLIDLKKLFTEHEQKFWCSWLPDEKSLLSNIDFLHYNHGLNITIIDDVIEEPIAVSHTKPSILYKQVKNKLQIQSVMEESKNFYLDDNITFYLFDANNPDKILDTISLNSSELDNFNLLELKLKTTKSIKMISNYSHLHIEEANDSTYYKF